MSEGTTTPIGSLSALGACGVEAETLWSRIAPNRSQGSTRRIVFVGTEPGSGTSLLACCAAAGLARNLQAKVMLIELGAGSSRLAGLLALPEGPGFHELLCASASTKGCVRGCGLNGLGVVTAGKGMLPPGLLASEQARGVFEQLGTGQDFVLIDAPPLLSHSELRPILLHADEAVLVFEADRTKREHARELVELVTRAGLTVLGSILARHGV